MKYPENCQRTSPYRSASDYHIIYVILIAELNSVCVLETIQNFIPLFWMYKTYYNMLDKKDTG
jgi:hypothetical protein